MNALEKYAAKRHLTNELVKSAQAGLLARVGAGIGEAFNAVKGAKLPEMLGKTFGGKTLGEASATSWKYMKKNKLPLGAAVGGGLLLGRATKRG